MGAPGGVAGSELEGAGGAGGSSPPSGGGRPAERFAQPAEHSTHWHRVCDATRSPLRARRGTCKRSLERPRRHVPFQAPPPTIAGEAEEHGGKTRRGVLGSGFGTLVLASLAGSFVHGCYPAIRLSPNDADRLLDRQLVEAPNPAMRGPYPVLTLYYGSGTDLRRPEYRDSVAIVTPTVDASALVDLGGSADERNDYWGFTPEEMPLNARVWYPDGDGPFPLVLVVHGNHDMRDFSDPGYDYLGDLLASRGYVLASIDQNFINGGIRGENDARGWFLLKHLEQFEGFGSDEENPFFGLVDMSRIALIGHSRGGEAVANAVAFNSLARYPDDANLRFDFDFDIRGIVSIAPVDGQYLPTGRKVVVEDVSFLTFHGSHDGDVTSFHGLRLYDRVELGDADEPLFKAAIYVYRANHGQWNTVWGAHDRGPRSGRSLDLRSLLPTGEQMRFAEIYVSAFLEAVLRRNYAYLPIFRDHRVAGEWLPKTMYQTRFETNAFQELASFEEDIDVETGSLEGVRLRGDSLAVWKESTLGLRSSNRPTTSASQETQVVTVGWRPPGDSAMADGVGKDPRGRTKPETTPPRTWRIPGAWRPAMPVARPMCSPPSLRRARVRRLPAIPPKPRLRSSCPTVWPRAGPSARSIRFTSRSPPPEAARTTATTGHLPASGSRPWTMPGARRESRSATTDRCGLRWRSTSLGAATARGVSTTRGRWSSRPTRSRWETSWR